MTPKTDSVAVLRNIRDRIEGCGDLSSEMKKPARLAALDAAMAALSAQGEAGFGVSDESLKLLLSRCLKPEEIAGDSATQHDRVHELVAWFARFANGDANAKWANAHAFELAYYLATTGGNRQIDLRNVREKAFKEGLNVSPSERAMLERLGVAKPSAPAAGDGDKQNGWRRRRLAEIQRIIEAVDNRAMANDDDVPTTMQEMTQAEMSRIYDLARGVNCAALAGPAEREGET